MKEKKIKGNVKKGEVYEVFIKDIGSDGEGIGRTEEGCTLFVKDALPGDRVKVQIMKAKSNYAYARLVEIIEASQYRLEPSCALASRCGGCQLQHLSYQKQLEYKQNKIKNCLIRIGGFSDIEAIMEPVMGMENPFFYRNKAQLPVGRDKGNNLVIGFYAGRTHSIIDMTRCYLQHPVNERILEGIRSFIEECKIEVYSEAEHTGLIRHILTRIGYATGEIMVCLVINGNELPCKERMIEILSKIEGMKSICLNVNRERTNIILGREVKTLWGLPYITDYIGEVQYRISPLSFYQVNPQQTRRLYETAMEFADLRGKEIVWDLYCGIGTISLFLAGKARMVYGVEIVPQAVEDARKNAKINGIENVRFFAGAAEEVLPREYQESRGEMSADIVVMDPPRKGCERELLDTIVKLAPQKVVYISCDPATLARDARYLADRGYEVKRVRGCDMFAHTAHVECVCLITHTER